jgi:hypothetical protein
MAAVTGQQVATLRAALTFDQAHVQAWRTRVHESGDLAGFSELLHAAFLLAARRRFAPAWTRAGVVRYVGSIRASAPPGDDIDPVTAEALILRALGADQPLHAGLEAKVAVQAILLGALIADFGLGADELEEFLVQARSLADRWLSGAVR